MDVVVFALSDLLIRYLQWTVAGDVVVEVEIGVPVGVVVLLGCMWRLPVPGPA